MPGITKEPIIKVGILLNSEVCFELKGSFKCRQSELEAGEYAARIENGIIDTGFCRAETVELTPLGTDATFVLKNVSIGIGFHWEQQVEQEFEGGLYLQPENGMIRAVNHIPLEKYLKSVISSEMSAMNDPVLLNAHAIVSRSWLLAQIFEKITEKEKQPKPSESEIVKWYDREDHRHFDVCADDHCQRYQGVTRVISENAQKAIDATRGTVLMHNNEICDARYSKCCGGVSEAFENVWQASPVPYLRPVHDKHPIATPVNTCNTPDSYFTNKPEAFCNTGDEKVLSQVLVDFDRQTQNFYRWKESFKQEGLSALIKKKSGIDFGEIIDLIPLERGYSGRIIRLKIIGTKLTFTVGKELEIRKWLSESHLYSSAFIVEKHDLKEGIPGTFILRGAGWGHGVGLCQIGAAVMSQKGYSVQEILEHYFKGAECKEIY
jgi:SpoIID/LytB domain protein